MTKQPIYTKLTFKQRKSVQRLLSIHCANIRWGSNTEVKENDFSSIRRDIIVKFDFKQSGLCLVAILNKDLKAYKIKLIEPKAFLKQTKGFSDSLRSNNKSSGVKSGKRKRNVKDEKTISLF